MAVFTPKNLDYELSPYTGLTRESWIEAGEYLLEGIFNNIPDMDAPIIMPRTETEVTYPHLKAPENVRKAELKAEIFEGLTRSLFIASVLMADAPELKINGILIRDYYKLHILRSCTDKSSDEYVGSYEDMQKLTASDDPFRPYQQTVETCALVIGLYMCKDVIWESYTDSERDAIASFLSGFAHANTVPQNWRLFNMLDMAFLDMYGYETDRNVMADHAKAVLDYYVGDGWYRDGHSFDYYSCWAFNFYAPLWNLWYGYEKMPEISARFEENSNKLMETYPDMFDYDGYTNMWGRSCIYRNAATSPFDGNLFLNAPTVNPGLARRIASGSLMQFLGREDFLSKGIPSLGFYGQFTPLVQGYSCAESPFWLGKAFMCLHLKADHPFWSAKENNGTWDGLSKGEVKETVLDGPALVLTNHEANRETILRTAKVLKDRGDIHGMWNYSKLNYNTKYPWESSPCQDETGLHNTDRTESQQYVLRSGIDDHIELANVTFYGGCKDGVLYRRQFFEYELKTECHWLQAVDLADYPMPLGIMRADRFRICKRPMYITLGAYGFPDNGHTDIHTVEGRAVKVHASTGDETIGQGTEGGAYSLIPKAIILKGKDSVGRDKRLAMTVYAGFDDIGYVKSRGTNPESECSVIAYGKGGLMRQYDASEDYLYISQVITLDEARDFTVDELFPIRDIALIHPLRDKNGTCIAGSASKIIIEHMDRSIKAIDYSGIEGRLSL